MITLQIECQNRLALRVDELINGDVELTIMDMEGGREHHLMPETFQPHLPLEKITVPKERRCMLAEALVGGVSSCDVVS